MAGPYHVSVEPLLEMSSVPVTGLYCKVGSCGRDDEVSCAWVCSETGLAGLDLPAFVKLLVVLTFVLSPLLACWGFGTGKSRMLMRVGSGRRVRGR